MLTNQDKEWLSQEYPRLIINGNKISGVINFTATYNSNNHKFQILGNNVADSVGGKQLIGKFKIRIEERADKIYSKLPALYLDELAPIQDRHFGQRDFSACLCSPLEEEEFLVPEFQFQKFFQQLIIPFLYGQIFYSAENRWPWDDYSHGGIGLLQSYIKFKGPVTKTFVKQFIVYLQNDRYWSLFKELLILPRPSKRNCPCGSGIKFRGCHPKEIESLVKLKGDISNFALSLNF